LYRQGTNSYGGKPWVWCELHGFGGNIGIEGNLGNLTTGPVDALKTPGSSMQGIGLTMEGHDQGNEIVYGLLLDQAWSASPINLTTYISSFVSQRYLSKSLPSAALEAWRILASTVYNNSDPNSQATVKSVFVLQPNVTGLTNLTGHHPTKIFYNTNDTIVPALKLLVQASKEDKALKGVPEFAYDVVNLARQLLANYFIDLYTNLITVYNTAQSTAEEIALAGKPLLDILGDLDEVLMTNEHFLLSNWIRSARALAGNDHQYADLLEYNARNQITLWGPQGQNNDYAAKDWGGLVRTYYLVRWQTFVDYLEESKRSATPYNATFVAGEMFKIADTWGNETWGERAGETWGTRGDTWQIVDSLLEKWQIA
jgi:alpha-N-acetylglucosaminidase